MKEMVDEPFNFVTQRMVCTGTELCSSCSTNIPFRTKGQLSLASVQHCYLTCPGKARRALIHSGTKIFAGLRALCTPVSNFHYNVVCSSVEFPHIASIDTVGTIHIVTHDFAHLLQMLAAMLHFLLGMIENPVALEKARSEIDAVIGPNRLPTFSDRPHLPYLECVMSETLRWGVPVPLGKLQNACSLIGLIWT